MPQNKKSKESTPILHNTFPLFYDWIENPNFIEYKRDWTINVLGQHIRAAHPLLSRDNRMQANSSDKKITFELKESH